MRLTPTRLMRRLRRDARGSALIPAIGIAMVTLVIAATLTAATMTSLSRTDDTRDVVTAGFAAEAGVAVAQQALATGCTTATDANGTEPFYRAVILRTTTSGEQAGCPAAGEPYRIVSTGYADARDFEARTGGRTVEARYTVEVTGPTLVPSGPAIYAYSSENMGGSGKLLTADGVSAAVHVRHGDVSCSGAGAGEADWVMTGRFTATGSCLVTGDVWAGSAEITGGGRVDGHVVVDGDATLSGYIRDELWAGGHVKLSGGATYVGGHVTGTSLHMSGSASVQGTARIGGDVTIKQATVGGSVVGANVALAGTVGDSVWAAGGLSVTNVSTIGTGSGAGNVCVAGNADFRNGTTIRGTLTALSVTKPDWVSVPTPQVGAPCDQSGAPGPITKPKQPAVADWVDLPWDPERWSGFTLIDLGTQCDFAALERAIKELDGRPGILDARDCSGRFNVDTYRKLKVYNDLAIFSHDFDLNHTGGSGGVESDTGEHNVWFINPDETADGAPTCDGQRMQMGGAFTFTGINAMFYTPCLLEVGSGLQIRGQVYAGGVDISGAATITYVPSGLPGVDLGDGTSTGPTVTPPMLDSYRDTSESAERWF